jgi:hypothetical protein
MLHHRTRNAPILQSRIILQDIELAIAHTLQESALICVRPVASVVRSVYSTEGSGIREGYRQSGG